MVYGPSALIKDTNGSAKWISSQTKAKVKPEDIAKSQFESVRNKIEKFRKLDRNQAAGLTECISDNTYPVNCDMSNKSRKLL